MRIPHGICVYGADHRVIMFNRAYAEVMAGAPLPSAITGSTSSAAAPRPASTVRAAPEEIAAQQAAFDVSRPQMRRRRRPNGTVVDVRTAPLPTRRLHQRGDRHHRR